jgi:capsule polysaccharide export protein KpsE/RkpR
MQNNSGTLEDVLKSILKYRKLVFWICASTFVIAAVISLLIPNRFQAVTSFYPASEDLSRPEVMFGKSKDRTYFYGGRNERDRIISVANSSLLLDSLLKKYDLYAHYDIEKDKEDSAYRLRKKFNKYYDIKKNELDAIELSFIDSDPRFAASVSNDCLEIINSLAVGMIKKSQAQFIETMDTKIKQSQKLFKQVNDSLKAARSYYRLFDVQNQTEQLSQMMTSVESQLQQEIARLESYKKSGVARRDTIANISARIDGLNSRLNTLNSTSGEDLDGMSLFKLNEGKPVIETLLAYYYSIRGQLAEDEIYFEMLKVAYNSRTPALHIVQEADVPFKKHSPKRSIIGIAATMAAFVFSILGLLLWETYKRIDFDSI